MTMLALAFHCFAGSSGNSRGKAAAVGWIGFRSSLSAFKSLVGNSIYLSMKCYLAETELQNTCNLTEHRGLWDLIVWPPNFKKRIRTY